MSSNYRQQYLVSSGQAQAEARAQAQQHSSCRPTGTSNRLPSRPDQRRDLELQQAMAECHLSGLAEATSEPHCGRPSDGLGSTRMPSDSNCGRPASSSSSYLANADQKQSNRRLHNNLLEPNDWRRQQVSEAAYQSDSQYCTRRHLSAPTTTTATNGQQQQAYILPANSNINNSHLQMAAAKRQERRQLQADFAPTTSGRHQEFLDIGQFRRNQQTTIGLQISHNNNNNNCNMRREEATTSDQDQYAKELRRTTQRHQQQDLFSNQSNSFNNCSQINQTLQQQQEPRTSASRQVTSLHVNFNRSSHNINGKQQNGAEANETNDHDHDHDDDDGEGGSGRKKKYLTAKYGQQQMNLIKKRLKIEMWLYEQLQELAKLTNSEAELDEIDIDLDQLLDMEDDQARRHWLQKTLQPFRSASADLSDERIATFIEEILGQSKLL